jgi:hypothetical protein
MVLESMGLVEVSWMPGCDLPWTRRSSVFASLFWTMPDVETRKNKDKWSHKLSKYIPVLYCTVWLVNLVIVGMLARMAPTKNPTVTK